MRKSTNLVGMALYEKLNLRYQASVNRFMVSGGTTGLGGVGGGGGGGGGAGGGRTPPQTGREDGRQAMLTWILPCG